MELAAPDPDAGENTAGSVQMVSLPWTRKPFWATKGVIGGPAAVADTAAEGHAVLAVIGRARRWVDEIMAGGTVTEIARREGKGERQIRLLMPLAFTPPDTVWGLIEGAGVPATMTELTKSMPLVWPA